MANATDYLSGQELEKLGFRSCGRHVYISRRAVICHPHRVSLGDMVRIDAHSLIDGGESVTIGRNVHIGSSVTISAAAPVVIGDFAGISSGTKIFTSDDDYSGDYLTGPTVPSEYSNLQVSPVEIGQHCVIGSNSVILPGSTIEEGAVVGALSLVKGLLAGWAIYGGAPARLLKKRSRKLLQKQKEFTSG
jgi:galactoside O-acetyltransferase